MPNQQPRSATASEKAWAMQWKAATPRLQEIRDRELRQLDDQLATKPTLPRPESPEQNGLVQFQRWMMRLALAEYSKSRG